MATEQDLEGSRLLVELLADKWTFPVLGALCSNGGRQRFNALRREIPDVSQKSLVACLKRLEINGLIERVVMTQGRLAVEYRVTPLGHSLDEPISALIRWSQKYRPEIEAARVAAAEREIQAA